MSKDLPTTIGIKRVGNTSFQLFQIKDGKRIEIITELYPIVIDRANQILQQMAEGTYESTK